MTHQSAYRAKDDPNSLLVTHGFATTAEAEAFLRGAELRDAMQRAGVQGQPRIEIYQDTWPFRRARRPSITGTAAGLAGPAMRSASAACRSASERNPVFIGISTIALIVIVVLVARMLLRR